MPDPIRVLIVDDSRIFRATMEELLSSIDGVEVVGSAWNGARALETIRLTPVDLVMLDLVMPKLDGFATLRGIQAFNQEQHKSVQTLVVSLMSTAGAKATAEALLAGAFDVIAKPVEADSADSRRALHEQLVEKIRIFRERRRRSGTASRTAPIIARPPAIPARPQFPHLGETPPPRSFERRRFQAICIASSTGGPAALAAILPSILAENGLPVFIVQHMSFGFTGYFAESLAKLCGGAVEEARDAAPVQAGTAYVAPAGQHLVLRRVGGVVHTSLNLQPPENRFRPSADVLFRSAAAVYGPDVIAVVLTGMQNDGAGGLGPLKRAGARIIAQDEATSVVYGMPRAAFETGYVDVVLPLDQIPAQIAGWRLGGRAE